MDQLKPVIKPLLLSLVIIAQSSVANAPLQQAKAELSTYESSLKQIGAKVQTINVRLVSYQTKIADAKSDLLATKNELDASRSALIQAQHDKSEDAPRKLELAQKKYDITQLGYENRQKRLARLTRKLDTLEKDKQKLMARSVSAQAQLKAQALKVVKLSSSSAKKPQTSPAAAPQKAVTKAPAKAAVPINYIEEDINKIRSDKEKSRSPLQTAKLEQNRDSETVAERQPLRSTNNPSANAQGSKTQRDYALAQMTSLNQKIESDASLEEWRQFRGLELKINRRSPEEFEYLGARQYYIETEMEPGAKRVKIGRKYYKANIPSEGTYVIIYDTADRNSPHFSLFKKSWFE